MSYPCLYAIHVYQTRTMFLATLQCCYRPGVILVASVNFAILPLFAVLSNLINVNTRQLIVLIKQWHPHAEANSSECSK